MANPCGFEATDPATGKKRYYKTYEEYVKAYVNGYIDISTASPELKAEVEKIKKRNETVLNAMFDAIEKSGGKRKDYIDSLSNLNKIITESFTEKDFSKSDIKKLLRAALSVGLKPNLDVAISNFVKTLDSVNLSSEQKRVIKEIESDRGDAVKSITNAKVTSSPYYVKSLLESLRFKVEDVSIELRGKYKEFIDSVNKINKPGEESVSIDELVRRGEEIRESIKKDLNHDKMELDSLMDRVSEYAAEKGMSSSKISEVTKSMVEDGFLDTSEKELIDVSAEQNPDLTIEKQSGMSSEVRGQYKESIKQTVDTLKKSRIDFPDTLDRATREYVDFILDNMNDGFLDSIKDNELRSVFNSLSGLESGFNSSSLRVIKYKLDSQIRANEVMEALNGAKSTLLFRPIARLKTVVKNAGRLLPGVNAEKTNLRETVFRNHLTFALDTILGVKKEGSPIYTNLFGKSSSASGKYEADLLKIREGYANPARKIISDANKDVKGIVTSNIKISIFLIDAMKGVLPNSPGISEYFTEIINGNVSSDKAYSREEKQIIRDEIRKYEALENKQEFLTPEELKVVDLIRGGIKELAPDAVALSYYMNQRAIIPNESYFPIQFKSRKDSKQDAEEIFNSTMQEMTRPGFSANNLKEKKGDISTADKFVNVIDPVSVLENYASQITKKRALQDEVTTTLRTFDLIDKNLSKDQSSKAEFFRSVISVARESYLDRTRNVVAFGSLGSHFLDKVNREVQSVLSTALLLSASKFGADTAANIVNVVGNIPEMSVGSVEFFKNKDIHNDIVRNLALPQAVRLLISETGEGTGVDIESRNVSGRGKTRRLDGSEFLANVSEKVKPVVDWVNWFNENQIKMPDQLTAIPLFYGTLIKTFKEITGKDIDLRKIGENDVAYMDANSAALKRAVIESNIKISGSVGTKNPYDVPAKTVLTDGGRSSVLNGLKQWMNFFNSYQSSMGTRILKAQGPLDKGKAIAITGASSYVYLKVLSAISGAMIAGVNSMLGGQSVNDPDEEEKVKKATRDIANTTVDLFVSNSTQPTKIAVSLGAEWLNEQFGEDVTRVGKLTDEKKINPTSIYPVKEDIDVEDLASKVSEKSMGSFGVLKKTMSDIFGVFDKEGVEAATSLGSSVASIIKIPVAKDFKRIIDSYNYDFIYNKAEIEKLKGKTTEEERRVYDKRIKQYLTKKFRSMFFLDFSPEKSVYDNPEEVKQAKIQHRKDVERVLDANAVDLKDNMPHIDRVKNTYYLMFLSEKIMDAKEIPLFERRRMVSDVLNYLRSESKTGRSFSNFRVGFDEIKQEIENAKKKGFPKNKSAEIEYEKKVVDDILNRYSSEQLTKEEAIMLINNFVQEEMKYDESSEYLEDRIKKTDFKMLRFE